MNAPASQNARIGIVTVSDRASRGDYEDRGGPEIQRTLEEYLRSPWEPLTRVIPDDRAVIEATLTNSPTTRAATWSSPPAAPDRPRATSRPRPPRRCASA